MTAPPTSLAVVVPAYNEAQRIPSTLRSIADHFAIAPFPVEIIVVDDGSSDDTAAVVRAIATELSIPLTLLRYAPNRGKGFALKVGFAATRADRILFSDADLSTPIEEADRFVAALESADVAIGSRKTARAAIEVRQPWLRETLGKGFTALVRLLIADVTDATCGFKAYRGDAGRDLYSRMRVFDWSFDAEMLLVGRLRGLTRVEVPVRWRDRAGTKVSLRRDLVRSLRGLVRIRLNALRGVYGDPLDIDVVIDASSPRSETRTAAESLR
jgi:dolichyl-phosphate beta-glucosyltransferase